MKEFYEECEKLKEDIVQIPSCSKLTKNIQEAEVETATMAKHVQRMDDLNEARLVLRIPGVASALKECSREAGGHKQRRSEVCLVLGYV